MTAHSFSADLVARILRDEHGIDAVVPRIVERGHAASMTEIVIKHPGYPTAFVVGPAYFKSNDPELTAYGNAQSFYVDLDPDSDEDDTHMVDSADPMTETEIASYVVEHINSVLTAEHVIKEF